MLLKISSNSRLLCVWSACRFCDITLMSACLTTALRRISVFVRKRKARIPNASRTVSLTSVGVNLVCTGIRVTYHCSRQE